MDFGAYFLRRCIHMLTYTLKYAYALIKYTHAHTSTHAFITTYRYNLREAENKLIGQKQMSLIDAERKLEKAMNSGATTHEKVLSCIYAHNCQLIVSLIGMCTC